MIRITGRCCEILVSSAWSGGEVKCNFPASMSGDFFLEARIKNSDDLMQLLLLGDYFKSRPLCNVKSLNIGYFPYGRADREMQKDTENNGTVCVEANGCRAAASLIRAAFPHTHIQAIDAHNPRVLEAHGIFNVYPYFWSLIPKKDATIIAPDAGSVERAFKYFNTCGPGSNFIQCNKHRDSSGKPITVLPDGEYKETCVIVDDIIDGGRTFSDLASRLRDKGAKQIELVVTHGIFSYGFDIPGIDKIHTTNTFLDKFEFKPFELDSSLFPSHVCVYKELA